MGAVVRTLANSFNRRWSRRGRLGWLEVDDNSAGIEDSNCWRRSFCDESRILAPWNRRRMWECDSHQGQSNWNPQRNTGCGQHCALRGISSDYVASIWRDRGLHDRRSCRCYELWPDQDWRPLPIGSHCEIQSTSADCRRAWSICDIWRKCPDHYEGQFESEAIKRCEE